MIHSDATFKEAEAATYLAVQAAPLLMAEAPQQQRGLPPARSAPVTKTRVVVLGSGWGAVAFIKNLDPEALGGEPGAALLASPQAGWQWVWPVTGGDNTHS